MLQSSTPYWKFKKNFNCLNSMFASHPARRNAFLFLHTMALNQRPISSVFVLLLILFAPSLLCQGTKTDSGKPKFNWSNTKFVHAFGDSYSFVQGTRGTANFSFIGNAQDFAFTPEELLTTAIIPHNTSSEGSNWLEFLTGCFEGLPSRCAKQLWDFSFAGADIDGNLLPLHMPFTVPLVNQVQQWIEFGADIIPHPPDETLTTWWIGINDTGDTVNNATITDFTAFWRVEMESYFRAVQAATDRGLRTHLFINVPPEERSPGSLGDATKAALLKTHIDEFNAVLAQQVASFESANPDTIVMTFDAHGWFNMVLDNPQEFGFTNTTGFCTCAEPTGFFWFNTGHPTQRVHQLIAQAIEESLLAHQ